MADDFQMRMLDLMAEYSLKSHQEENIFYFDNLPTIKKCDELEGRIKEIVVQYSRKVSTTRMKKQIIVRDSGGRIK